MILTSLDKAHRALILTVALCAAAPAWAGPPYITDDPEPTDTGHYEIYAYTEGETAGGGTGGEIGIDFNYGAIEDVQLTAVIPLVYDAPKGAKTVADLGNIELGVKYRFLHQDDIGVDVAFFPTVVLPSASHKVGDDRTSIFLPIWVEHDWEEWSTFGGGGCTITHGAGTLDSCTLGWAVTHQILPDLRIGMEVVHTTPDFKGERASTGIGAGLQYDINDTIHLLAYAGPGLQHPTETARANWYFSVLFAF